MRRLIDVFIGFMTLLALGVLIKVGWNYIAADFGFPFMKWITGMVISFLLFAITKFVSMVFFGEAVSQYLGLLLWHKEGAQLNEKETH